MRCRFLANVRHIVAGTSDSKYLYNYVHARIGNVRTLNGSITAEPYSDLL